MDERRARGWLRGGLGFVTLVAAVTLGASPASAILYRVHGNHYVSYERIQGKAAPSNIAPSNAARANTLSPTGPRAEIFNGALGYMNYSGGPVMPSSTDYVFQWGTGFDSGPVNGCGTNTHPVTCSDIPHGVDTYFHDLAASSQTNQPNMDQVATQYTANGGQPNFTVSAGGLIVDNDPYPANGCTSAPSGGHCLTDAQIQAELQSYLSSHGFPSGLSNEYFVVTPQNVASCFDSAGQECSGNASQNTVFCAYHSRTATSGQYVYSNIADVHEITGCDPFSSQSPSRNESRCDPNVSFDVCVWPNGYGDGVISAVSHEHNESITDPEPNNGWADWGQVHNKPGDENGDKCNFDGLDDPTVDFHDDGSNGIGENYTPTNQTVGSNRYLIQMEFSNQNFACINHYTASGSGPSASFTVSSSGTSATFSATPGAAQYVWQFNDDVAPGHSPQQFTETTTSPTISHTFPQLGTYTVALTAMAADGLSQASSQDVTLTNAPPPTGAPDTSITKSKVIKKKRKATFKFKGSGGVGALRFQCKIPGIKWTNCTSPVAVVHLKKHKSYTFQVRAIDSRGLKDPTPAKKSFKL